MNSSPANKPKSPDAPQAMSVKSVWGDISEVDTVFVDNLFLQVINDQFYLTFGQMAVPLDFDPRRSEGVKINPLVRLVLPAAAMKRVLHVLNETTAKHLKMGGEE